MSSTSKRCTKDQLAPFRKWIGELDLFSVVLVSTDRAYVELHRRADQKQALLLLERAVADAPCHMELWQEAEEKTPYLLFHEFSDAAHEFVTELPDSPVFQASQQVRMGRIQLYC